MLPIAQLPRYLLRAARLTCPLCGVTPLFCRLREIRGLSDWFSPLDGCRRCGYPYEREPGYFLLAIWGFNYFAAAAVALGIYLVLESLFRLPLGVLLAAIVLPTAVVAVLMARHSKALFLALDHFFDP